MSDDVSSRLVLVTAPASEPVSLAQAKSFLRIEHTADDDAITLGISAARVAAENYLRTALLPQTWDYIVANPSRNCVRLPLGPAQTITSITQTDTQGNISTLNAANYRLSVDGFLVLFENVPSCEKMTIRFSASLATTAGALPPSVIQGMLHHLEVMMDQRDGSVPMPMQSITLYAPLRRVML